MTDRVLLDAKSKDAHSADGWRTHIHREGVRINQAKTAKTASIICERKPRTVRWPCHVWRKNGREFPTSDQDQLQSRCGARDLISWSVFRTAPRTELRSLQPCVQARVGPRKRTLALWQSRWSDES